MDGGCCNCGLAHRDADLRQALDHVPRSIEPRHGRQLVRIDEQSTFGIMRRAEHGRQTGAGAQAKRHIKAFKAMRLAVDRTYGERGILERKRCDMLC